MVKDKEISRLQLHVIVLQKRRGVNITESFLLRLNNERTKDAEGQDVPTMYVNHLTKLRKAPQPHFEDVHRKVTRPLHVLMRLRVSLIN